MVSNGLTDGHAATTTTTPSPKIILYTNHRCPFAHRAHIVLKELNLTFEEVIIDLDTPRPQWYLDINPRGLVPSIKYSSPGLYEEVIITESAIVAQFLCDSFPSPLLPAPDSYFAAPLARARINFFVDTWNTKVASHWFAALMAAQGEAKDKKCDEWFAALEREIEPLLGNANPFFDGSRDLTFAEVHAGPFVVRWFALAQAGEDLLPRGFIERLERLPNFGRWSRAVREHESVTKVVEWQGSTDALRRKIQSLREKKYVFNMCLYLF